MSAQLERLIEDRPQFHVWPDGRRADWSVPPEVLRRIFRAVAPGMNTLETGAGVTTVAFCIAGARHTAVAPDAEQAARIRRYLRAVKIDADLTFVTDSSDVALPRLAAAPEPLDFVLIDGAHRFPFPILDWHYTAPRVPVGGILAVDDFRMPSVRILHDFLDGEVEWELEDAVAQTAFFRRVRETICVADWQDQNFNKRYGPGVVEAASGEPRDHRSMGLFQRLLGKWQGSSKC